MYFIGKHNHTALSKILSGNKWLHLPMCVLEVKVVAVYIYIIYNIIICNHVTSVSSQSVYARTKNIFSLTCIYNSGGYVGNLVTNATR